MKKLYWKENIQQKLKGTRAHVIILVLISVLSSLAVYFPFRNNMEIIYRYFDGPLYMGVARTWYEVPEGLDLEPGYFLLTLPLYSAIIRALALVFSYPVAMILTTLACTTGATVCFYFLLRELKCVKSPLYSAGLSLFLPVRWVIYHSVGATEPLFLLLAFLSLYLFQKEKYLWSFFAAVFLSATRSAGVLIAVVYFIMLLRKKQYKWIPALLIISAGTILTFLFHYFKCGDFFIYLKLNGGIMSNRIAATFRYYAGESHFGELYFLLTALYGAGLLLLWKYPLLFYYAAVYYIFNLFVQHEDISRMFIIIAPVTLIVAYDSIFSRKEFKIALAGIIMMVYIYAWNVIPGNLCNPEAYRLLLGK